MRRHVVVFVVGFLFAVGLAISGMTDANKVIGFLNVLGEWDPSLAFVMVGAIGVHFVFYRFVLHRQSPLLEESFRIPSRRDVDSRLLVGGALFGVGWGLGGFCPGPGIVSLVTMAAPVLVFVLAMLGGMVLYQALLGRLGERAESAKAADRLYFQEDA